VECGKRTTTWEAFKAHRKACGGHMTAGPQTPPAPLSETDLDHLASLYDQLHDEGAA
jgi:hypothetical protein